MRRKRDIDGNISYFDYDDNKIGGSGLISDLASKLFSKITSDTSKKLGKIAAEKIISKGSEEIGSAVGKKIAKKIEGTKHETKKTSNDNDKINEANITTEIAGDKIVKLLQEYNKKEEIKQPIINKNKYADISQQFDELLLS